MAFKDFFKTSNSHRTEASSSSKANKQRQTESVLSSEIGNIKQSLSELGGNFNQKRQQLSIHLFDEKAKIQSQMDYLQVQMSEVQQVIAKNMQVRNTLLSQQASELDTAVQPIRQQNSQLNEEVAKLQDEAKAHVDKNQPMSQQLRDLTQKQTDFDKRATELASQLKEEKDPALIVEHVDKLRTAIEENEHERSVTDQKVAELSQTYTQSKAELKQIRQDLMAKQAQLKDNQAKINQKKQEIESADNDDNRRLHEAESEMAAKEQVTTGLREQLAPLQEKLAAIKKEIRDWLGSDYPVNLLNIDDQQEYIIDMDGFDDQQLPALKQVVQYLIGKGVTRIGLYVSDFSLNAEADFNSWIDALDISELNVKTYNPLLNLQKQGELAAKFQLRTDAVSDEWDDGRTERVLTFDDGSVQKVHYYDVDQKIADVEYYQNDKLVETRFISPQGQLVQRRLYNDNGSQHHDEYYTQSGTEMINVIYEQDKVTAVKLLNPTGQVFAAFDNTDQLAGWWLQNHFASKGIFVGFLDNDQYRELLKSVKNDALTLLNHEAASDINLMYWLNGFEHSQFLTDTYESEVLLTKAVDKPIEVGFVDQRNLPFQLGVMGDIQ